MKSILPFIFRNLPLFIVNFLSFLIGHFLVLFLKRERLIAFAQLKAAQIPGSHRSILANSYRNCILSIFEAFQSRKLLGIQDKPEADGKLDIRSSHSNLRAVKHSYGKVNAEKIELFNKALEANTGLLCLGSHLSSYELMIAYFTLHDIDAMVFARKPKGEWSTKLIEDLRIDAGIDLLWRDAPDAGTKLMRAIRKKKALCALIDQDTALENGFSPFFGIEAAHPLLPIKIAIRFSLPVLTFSMIRLPGHTFCIDIKEINWQAQDDPESFILKEYNRYLEELITEYPDQWVWWHRRWRRRPGVDYSSGTDNLRSTQAYIEWLDRGGWMSEDQVSQK